MASATGQPVTCLNSVGAEVKAAFLWEQAEWHWWQGGSQPPLTDRSHPGCHLALSLPWHNADTLRMILRLHYTDTLIQELKDYGEHWFSILGKRQEARHHSTSTWDANGLFKMLLQRSLLAILFFCLCRAFEVYRNPQLLHLTCLYSTAQLRCLSCVNCLYTASVWSATGNTGSLNSDIWFKDESRVTKYVMKLLTLFVHVGLQVFKLQFGCTASVTNHLISIHTSNDFFLSVV